MFGKRKEIEPKPEGKNTTPRKGVFMRMFFIILVLVLLTFGGGFMYFLSLIPTKDPGTGPEADGIVVLTGGPGRIQKAVWLVSTSSAQKLLISGVNKITKTGEINELKNISPQFIDCCITLDHEAKNTIENATETHLWAKRNDLKSLVLVTSNYHIPRSLQEMKLASPRIAFIPYPVINKNVQIKNWWEFPGTRRLLLREYFKYILSIGRSGLIRIGVKSTMLKTEPANH